MRDIARTVEGLADGLRSDLVELARIPSIAFPGHPEAPVLRARDQVAELLRAAGMESVMNAIRTGGFNAHLQVVEHIQCLVCRCCC